MNMHDNIASNYSDENLLSLDEIMGKLVGMSKKQKKELVSRTEYETDLDRHVATLARSSDLWNDGGADGMSQAVLMLGKSDSPALRELGGRMMLQILG